MEHQNIDMLINEADQLLHSATAEMQRSEEDVTAHMVCYNSRQSIINYLVSYLVKNGEALNKPVTMAGLLEQCRALDGRFDLIDISPINCRHDEDSHEYCLSVDKVNECLDIAKQTRAIAINEAPTY